MDKTFSIRGVINIDGKERILDIPAMWWREFFQIGSYFDINGCTISSGNGMSIFHAKQGKCVVCNCAVIRHNAAPHTYPHIDIIHCNRCPSAGGQAHPISGVSYPKGRLSGLYLPMICAPGLSGLWPIEGEFSLSAVTVDGAPEVNFYSPPVKVVHSGGIIRVNRPLLYTQQGGRCNACFVQFGMNELTDDHIVPKSKGGTTEHSNIQLLCERCNHRKDSKDMGEYMAYKYPNVYNLFVL